MIQTLILTHKQPLTPRVTLFRFEHPDGTYLPVFSGGAHVVVQMQDGATLRRNPYSLVSDPGCGRAYEIAVQREADGRGGSRFLHDVALPGMRFGIGAPVNLFALDLTARRHLLIAGGIGITPFLAQRRDLARRGVDHVLHYAIRSRADALPLPDLPGGAGPVHLHVGDEGGRMDLTAILSDQPLGTQIHVCGPARLIDAVQATATAIGWPPETIHAEEFLAPATGAPFDVHCARSDRRLTVAPQESLLEALEAAGIDAPWMCRGGACGQCETKVLAADGTILHHDHWLAPEDRARRIMPCVSRFAGPLLTIDR